jgi:ribosomal protein S18 acetylase RimI-like enzyme
MTSTTAPSAPLPAVSIRPAVPDDAGALALLGQATFLETYAGTLPIGDITQHCEHAHSVGLYRQWLLDPATRIWLAEAEQGGAPVGYLVLGAPDLPLAALSPHDREIKRVYVLHRFQGAGLGRRLMATALEHAGTQHASRLLLGVYSRNLAAIAFYSRIGYTSVGHRIFHVGAHDYQDLILGLSLQAWP